MPERSLGGSRYFTTFVDDFTRKVWTYSLRSKDNALTVFSQWLAEVENRTRQTVKTLMSDNEGEYPTRAFKQYLSEKGIWPKDHPIHTHTEWSSGTDQPNDPRERNGNALALQTEAGILGRRIVDGHIFDKSFVVESNQARSAASTMVKEGTAYDRLHIFGCEAYAFIPWEKRTKLSPHATKCIFLGYGTDGEFGYRLWDPENRKLIRSSDVVFNEDSILTRNQHKIVGKNVSFEISTNGIEVPDHRT